MRRAPAPAHRVVVVGGGFAGLRAVRDLRDAPFEVALIDRRRAAGVLYGLRRRLHRRGHLSGARLGETAL